MRFSFLLCRIAPFLLLLTAAVQGQTQTILHSFDAGIASQDGNGPSAAPVLGKDGNFYGVTDRSSHHADGGTIYRITPQGKLTTLHDFADGSTPQDGVYANSLTLGKDGNFYGTTSMGGTHGAGIVFRLTPPSTEHPTGVYSILHNFDSTITDGYQPVGVMMAKNGLLYGTTVLGGTNSSGTVFKLDPATGAFSLLHSFGDPGDGGYPRIGLMQGADGALYGTTTYRFGEGDHGPTVFRITVAGSYKTLASFNPLEGSPTLPVQALDGNFYITANSGTTTTFFRMTPAGQRTILAQVPVGSTTSSATVQAATQGVLLAPDGYFYITSDNLTKYGTLLKISPQGLPSPLTNVSGIFMAGVVFGPDGAIYGTDFQGGTASQGSFFKIVPGTSALTSPLSASGIVGYPFHYQISGTQSPTRFGATGLPAGLSLDPQTGVISGIPTEATLSGASVTLAITNPAGVANLALPLTISPAELPVINSPLGADAQVGAPFVYQIKASHFPTRYTASALPAGLTFDGTIGIISGKPTATGGKTVKITAVNAAGASQQQNLTIRTSTEAPALKAPVFTLLNLFLGATSSSTLFQAFNGNLVLSHLEGNLSSGDSGGGVIIVNPNPVQTYRFLNQIQSLTSAGSPLGYVIAADKTISKRATDPATDFDASFAQASNGNLYGTGRITGEGSLFRMTPDGHLSTESSLVDGTFGLLEGPDDFFYGTTSGEVSNTLYRTTVGGTPSILHVFGQSPAGNPDPQDGLDPNGSVVRGIDATFYGTTLNGGTYGLGTIFKVTTTGAYSVLHSFRPDGPTHPSGPLILGTDGYLYGISGGGTADKGTVFKTSRNSGLTVTLHNFGDGTVKHEGTSPWPSLLQGFDGNFYGTTKQGGLHNQGTVYRITPDGTTTIVYSFQGNSEIPSLTQSGLIQATDGNLYGLCRASEWSDGSRLYCLLANQAPRQAPAVVGPQTKTLAAKAPGSFLLLLRGVATSWTVTGNLPPGMNLDPQTGLVSGTPIRAGKWSFNLTAANAAGSVTKKVTLTVQAPPVIKVPTGAIASPGATFTYKIDASNPPSTYGAANLPPGVNFDLFTGTLYGTAPAKGRWVITLTATNGGGTSQVEVLLSTTQQAQTLTFPAVGVIPVGTSVPLEATANSGLKVTYTVISGPAQITGNRLVFTGVGTARITASQSGNAAYLPAKDVSINARGK